MRLIKNYWLIAVGILVGLSGGYLYWQQIGCVSGKCLITSSPINSSLYGAMMGGLLFMVARRAAMNFATSHLKDHLQNYLDSVLKRQGPDSPSHVASR